MDEDRVTCRATRRDGEPCRAKAGPAGYCFGHDPDLAQRHEEGRSVGGRNRATAARVGKLLQGDGEIVDVLGLLKTAMVEAYAGTLDARSAGALASLSNALVRMHEIGTLELRIKALENRGE